MKLIFPNGEHEPVVLAEGITRVGSGADCQVMLAAPGVALHHCEFETQGDHVSVRALDAGAATVLNGKQIGQASVLKPGDLLLFGRIGCRVVAAERVAPPPPVRRPAVDEESRTRMRMALPKYMLRGVSGTTFGKSFALVGSMTIGRQGDCDISIPAEEISRHHARLQVAADGVMVEDLGSANGTFINDKRVHNGLLKPGEELRLDTVRFRLLAPGMDVHPAAAPRSEAPVAAPTASSGRMVWVVIGIVVLALIAFGIARSLGKI